METATLFTGLICCYLLCCFQAKLLSLCVGFFPPLNRKIGPLHVFNPTFLQDTNISAFNWLQFYRRVCPRCDCSKMKEHQCWTWMFPIQLPVAPSFYFESFFHLSMEFPSYSGNPGFFPLFSQVTCNCFTISNGEMQDVGVGLYPR